MHPKFAERVSDVVWDCCPDDLHAVTLTHPDRTRIGIHDPLRDGWWVWDFGDWQHVDSFAVVASTELGHMELEARDE